MKQYVSLSICVIVMLSVIALISYTWIEKEDIRDRACYEYCDLHNINNSSIGNFEEIQMMVNE